MIIKESYTYLVIFNKIVLIIVVGGAAIDNGIDEKARVEDVVENRVADVLGFISAEGQLVRSHYAGCHKCSKRRHC